MTGEKIHMLHGSIGSQFDWTAAKKFLEDRGFLTKCHDLYDYLQVDDCSFDRFSRSFINDLTEKEGNEVNHHLLGYSLGGRLALHALLERPLLWKKAVIVSAHTGLPHQGVNERERRVQSDMKWAEMASNKDLPWSEFLKKWNQQGVLSSPLSDSLNWFDRQGLEPVRGQVASSFRAWGLGLQEDLLDEMSSLTVPVLWVVGEHDQKFLELAKKAISVLPNAKLQVVENAGHRVPWEQPEEFHSLVSEWFTGE